MTWHYAVWKWSSLDLEPACVHYREDLTVESGQIHGITINRGDVNCENCKRMMGMV